MKVLKMSFVIAIMFAFASSASAQTQHVVRESVTQPYIQFNVYAHKMELVTPPPPTFYNANTPLVYANGTIIMAGDGEIYYIASYGKTYYKWKKLADHIPVAESIIPLDEYLTLKAKAVPVNNTVAKN